MKQFPTKKAESPSKNITGVGDRKVDEWGAISNQISQFSTYKDLSEQAAKQNYKKEYQSILDKQLKIKGQQAEQSAKDEIARLNYRNKYSQMEDENNKQTNVSQAAKFKYYLKKNLDNQDSGKKRVAQLIQEEDLSYGKNANARAIASLKQDEDLALLQKMRMAQEFKNQYKESQKKKMLDTLSKQREQAEWNTLFEYNSQKQLQREKERQSFYEEVDRKMQQKEKVFPAKLQPRILKRGAPAAKSTADLDVERNQSQQYNSNHYLPTMPTIEEKISKQREKHSLEQRRNLQEEAKFKKDAKRALIDDRKTLQHQRVERELQGQMQQDATLAEKQAKQKKYKQYLDGQMQALRHKELGVGTMNNDEKNFNRQELRDYQTNKNHMSALIPGINNLQTVGASPLKRGLRREEHDRAQHSNLLTTLAQSGQDQQQVETLQSRRQAKNDNFLKNMLPNIKTAGIRTGMDNFRYQNSDIQTRRDASNSRKRTSSRNFNLLSHFQQQEEPQINGQSHENLKRVNSNIMQANRSRSNSPFHTDVHQSVAGGSNLMKNDSYRGSTFDGSVGELRKKDYLAKLNLERSKQNFNTQLGQKAPLSRQFVNRSISLDKGLTDGHDLGAQETQPLLTVDRQKQREGSSRRCNIGFKTNHNSIEVERKHPGGGGSVSGTYERHPIQKMHPETSNLTQKNLLSKYKSPQLKFHNDRSEKLAILKETDGHIVMAEMPHNPITNPMSYFNQNPYIQSEMKNASKIHQPSAVLTKLQSRNMSVTSNKRTPSRRQLQNIPSLSSLSKPAPVVEHAPNFFNTIHERHRPVPQKSFYKYDVRLGRHCDLVRGFDLKAPSVVPKGASGSTLESRSNIFVNDISNTHKSSVFS